MVPETIQDPKRPCFFERVSSRATVRTGQTRRVHIL